MGRRIFLSAVVVAVGLSLSGCKCPCEQGAPAQAVTLSDVPAPARATIEELMAGGEITKIDREGQGDKAIYDVEGKMQDKAVEYDVAADGTVLSTEESVPYASLPQAVRTAAARYFGSSEGLSANKEVEKGKTFYEVEGTKGGTVITLKLTDAGKIVEEEKE
ncbi:MAG: hypothetical protein JW955_20295 [Sedimentisphaerales bacterium]|nr:hypothetical protein [Sedimentisphaerales bacterium]